MIDKQTKGQGQRVTTGIAGLDNILEGGFLPGRSYLVRGGPGCGKTTLGCHFLAEGVAQKQNSLFISCSQPESDLRADAEHIGVSLKGTHLLDLSPNAERFAQNQTYDLFPADEVEREDRVQQIVSEVEAVNPQRVFVDSITQLRYLAPDLHQFQQQVLSFMRLLRKHGATVLFCSEASEEAPDEDVQFMCDGVITLSRVKQFRTLEISKMRGSNCHGGPHNFKLTPEGMQVFPNLVLEPPSCKATLASISSAIPAVDEMLCGGLPSEATTILTGPSGIGKTSLGLLFAKEMAARGKRAVLYTFEEDTATLIARAEAINIPIGAMQEAGSMRVQQICPLQISIQEFTHLVRQEVKQHDTGLVMIDSMAGLRLSNGGQSVMPHLFGLTRYLTGHQVTCILINEVESVTGDFQPTERGLSHLCDCLVFLRYIELEGELRRAIGVLKKRTGDFQKHLRELSISSYGIRVGEPLKNVRGLLNGFPEFIDAPSDVQQAGVL